MPLPLVPIVVVGLLPLALAGVAFRLFERSWFRGVFLVVTAGALALSWPRQGLDFDALKRMSLFLALGAALVLLLKHLGVPWALDRTKRLRALALLAAASVTVYTNFFAFHGEGVFVHLHDVAHYYLGSKYFAELGYTNLYTAMVRAEGEKHEGRFRSPTARELATNEVLPVTALLARSDTTKAAFTPERWADFRRDVEWFHETLGPHWNEVLADHGFNPTPLWALLGGGLANLVPAGSGRGIFLLTLLDPILLAGAFGAIAWAFGAEAMLLSIIHFCVIFGASFGWTGGAFLRYIWFFGVIVAACLVKKGRFGGAGALLALAAVLRVFPAFFLAAPAFQLARDLFARRPVRREHLRLFGAFGVTAALLFGATLSLPQGLAAWGLFRTNIKKHMETVAPNIIGLTPALAHRSVDALVPPEEGLKRNEARQKAVYRVQLFTLVPLALLFVFAASRGAGDVEALALGAPLLLAGLNLAAYYWALLVLLTLAFHDRPRRLVALFGLEIATYALFLFEGGEALLYMERSVLLAMVLVALLIPGAREWVDRKAEEEGE